MTSYRSKFVPLRNSELLFLDSVIQTAPKTNRNDFLTALNLIAVLRFGNTVASKRHYNLIEIAYIQKISPGCFLRRTEIIFNLGYMGMINMSYRGLLYVLCLHKKDCRFAKRKETNLLLLTFSQNLFTCSE